MQQFHHITSVREAVFNARRAGKKIGFVPTMGNLHDAHIALVKQALTVSDFVVASVFVNRLQFGLNEDWDTYPRTLTEDAKKLREAGCHILFCPDEHEIYPNGMDQQTRVIVPSMSDILCGASRPGHFEGVTTVVTKLFNIVQPDVAIFGIKDYQQLAIIRRMVQDLCLPVEILASEIVRESDGLAMSSRNGFITEDERPRVAILNQTLRWICAQIQSGDTAFSDLEKRAMQRIMEAGFKPDYISIRESQSLALAADDDKNITVLGAMYTNAARLIDNVSIRLDRAHQEVI